MAAPCATTAPARRRRSTRAENREQPPASVPVAALRRGRVGAEPRGIDTVTAAMCLHEVHQVGGRLRACQPGRLRRRRALVTAHIETLSSHCEIWVVRLDGPADGAPGSGLPLISDRGRKRAAFR
jgi:hypothetical protein